MNRQNFRGTGMLGVFAALAMRISDRFKSDVFHQILSDRRAIDTELKVSSQDSEL